MNLSQVTVRPVTPPEETTFHTSHDFPDKEGAGYMVQLIAFSTGTIISFFGVRPFILKYGHKKGGDLKTNVHSLVGKIGKVIVTIDNSQSQGRVIVEGDDWKAETENDEILNAGERVEILKVDSTILTVKLIKKEN